MPSTPPPFLPEQRPTGQYLLFVLTPGAGWGAALAACHHDDFDEILAAIPMEGQPIWHVLDLATGRICGSWNRELDEPWPGVRRANGELPTTEALRAIFSAGERWVEDLLHFEPADDSWGALCANITRRGGDAVAESWVLGGRQVIDTRSSVLYVNGAPALVIPAFADIVAYQQVVAEWAVEHAGDVDDAQPPEGSEGSAADSEAARFMSGSPLPENWQELSNDELRTIIEAAEQAQRAGG